MKPIPIGVEFNYSMRPELTISTGAVGNRTYRVELNAVRPTYRSGSVYIIVRIDQIMNGCFFLTLTTYVIFSTLALVVVYLLNPLKSPKRNDNVGKDRRFRQSFRHLATFAQLLGYNRTQVDLEMSRQKPKFFTQEKTRFL